MAEGTAADTSVPKPRTTKKPRRPRKSGAPKQARRNEAEGMVTEQPVPNVPQKKTTQYVVTVDNQTGLPLKLEKLEHAGKRKELTKEEYAAVLGYSGLSSPFSAGSDESAQASQQDVDSLVQAYYQGVTDYINALTSDR